MKNLLFFLAIVFSGQMLLAQEQKPSTPRVFVDQNHQVFWNRKLPVYINVSTKPNQQGTQLKQEGAPVALPYFFDTEGVNYMRTKWATDEKGNTIFPKTETLWPVSADGLAPISKLHFHFQKVYRRNGITYYDPSLKVSFTSKDAVSGLDSIMYSFQGKPYALYAGNQLPVSAGKQLLKIYGIDRVGNVEGINDRNTFNFEVDATAPESTHEVVGPQLGNILSPKTKILLKSKDEGAGVKEIQFDLEKTSEKHYAQPITLSHYTEGEQQLAYWATDYVGNVEKKNQYAFFLDKSAPVVKFHVSKDEFISKVDKRYISGRSEVSLSATDNKAGVDYISFSVDGEPFANYTQAFKADFLSERTYRIKYNSIDKVENKSATVIKYFAIDKTAPELTLIRHQPFILRKDTTFVRSISPIQLRAFDKGTVQSGIKNVEYKDGSAFQTYSEKFTLKKPYIHLLEVRVTDNVNNVNNFKYNFFVDDFAPEIYHHFSVTPSAEGQYPNSIILYLAAKDKHVGNDKIYYSINGGEEKLYRQPIRYFKNGTKVKVKIRAVDLLGNESSKDVTFEIEK